MNPFHTPTEMIQFSNMAHWFEGGLLGIIVLIAIFTSLGYIKFKSSQLAGSILVLIAGGFLVPYMLLHHGLGRVGATWQFLMNDPQQRQHLIMGLLLMLAGLAELMNALSVLKSKLWQMAFPTALAVIGVLFMIHDQHGTAEAMHASIIFHRYLGSALILSGILKAVAVIFGERYKKLHYIWIVFLAITSILLVTYREPEGAYQIDHSNIMQHVCNEQGCSAPTNH